MTIKKEEIGKMILMIWFVVATVYMGYDIWDDYKVIGVQKAYNQGIEDMTVRVIDEVGKRGCEPVEIYAGEKKVQIANAQCLPQPEKIQTETKK